MSDAMTYTTGVSEPVTVESMLKIAEELKALTPDCWHYDLVTGEWLPKTKLGAIYVCVRCAKRFLVHWDTFGDKELPERISIDPFAGHSFKMEASE